MIKMQITKIATALLFATITSAHTDFIKDGNRAELFEIMDQEVPEFRITVPDDAFAEIKRQMNQGGGWFKRQWGGDQWGGQQQGGQQNNPWGGGQQWGGQQQGGQQNNPWGGGQQWGGQPQWGGQQQGGQQNNPWGGGQQWGGQPQWGGQQNNPWMGGDWMGGDWMGGDWMGGITQKENYKIKDCQMVVKINGGEESFEKINFGIGGSSSRSYARQAFNLKIKGKKNLYGRKQFRIRSEAREATYLRSKLACDMHNRLGLPSISANYITLYVNNEYWGFYVLMDAPKPSWAELQYGDKDTVNLYKCKAGAITLSAQGGKCENENEDVTDTSNIQSLFSTLDRYNNARDIDTIFDVDQFLYEMAYEYLTGSWDHYLVTGHNFALYKMPQNHGGKWTMVHYDFDADFGQDVCAVEFAGTVKTDKDYPSWSWEDWSTKKSHLLDVLIKNDRSRFNNIMKRFVEEAFNPELLFPRIDELKDFIRPYVKKDKTPVNGKKPGMLNEKVNNDYTMAQWEANSEFTNIGVSSSSSGYGLKFWILNRYRKVCKDFKLNCNQEYLDLNYYYDIDRDTEGPINTQFVLFPIGNPAPNPQPRTTQSQPPKPKTTRTTTSKTTTTTTRKPTITQAPTDCVVASQGYPCCSSWNTNVVYQDESGDWGVENDEWCGITKLECWSTKLGYPCCSQCLNVVFSDGDGNWAVENDEWCGLAKSC